MFKKILITLMIVLMVVSVSTARELEGVTMPETLPVGSDMLGLNGIGLRNLMIIKVYVAGLYLKSASTDPAAIINADEPMIMRLQMLRDTKPKTMNQALLNGMRNAIQASKSDFSQIKDRTDAFKAMLYDPLEEGDVFNFIYKPGKGLEVYKGKELRGTVPGLDFKQAFFGIWLNNAKPADEGLKASLISGKFTTELAAIAGKMKQEQEAKVAAEAQAQADAAAAAAKKAEDDAKLAAATEKAKMDQKAAAATASAAVAGTQASAEATKKIAEVKKVEKPVAASAAKAQAKEMADMANVEAYASAEQFAADDVYFNVSSTKLNAAAKMNLARKVKYLKSNPGASVVLEPVCDTQGSKEKNMRLANKRADSVRNFMLQAGIGDSRIETVDMRQVDAAAAYVNNRRVHLSIK